MPMRGRGRGRGGRGGRGGGHMGRGGSRGGRGGTVRFAGAFEGIEGFTVAQAPELPTDPAELRRLAEAERATMTPARLRAMKITLLNTVSASLIKEPRFDNKGSSASSRIKALVASVSRYDPEFVLKVALYSRTELNIRSTSNFVLSLACNSRECAPFVRRYFSAAVRLPSDWLDVAATYQTLPDKALSGNAIPTCLRKAMAVKFPEFDAYQLAKYNKEGAIKRKKKKLRLRAEQNPGQAAQAEGKPSVTMKQMIRQLHLNRPVQAVMSILGKKYPTSETEFSRLGLPGVFRPSEAGKRMKLPVPETWETLLSQKGNRAATWEELIEHKKLPFMAMLRNLRNLIFTGVHPRYHRWVMNKLTDPKTIANSKQFPFRFFSAYEVIPADIEDFRHRLELLNNPPAKKARVREGAASAKSDQRRKRKHPFVPQHQPPPELFQQYRNALDTAVKLATAHNIKPIRGSTAVFVDISPAVNASGGEEGAAPAAAAGKFKQLSQIGILLGLMCKHACEDCEMRVFSPRGCERVDTAAGAILANVSAVESQGSHLCEGVSEDAQSPFPIDYVEDLIARHERLDSLLVLSNRLFPPSDTVGRTLAKYRQEVNPALLFVSVDLAGRGCAVAEGDSQEHPNDILVSGFSDAILRFVAERGDAAQLQHVEHIDVAAGLPALPASVLASANPIYSRLEDAPEVFPVENQSEGEEGTVDHPMEIVSEADASPVPRPVIGSGQKWRVARVFISSTFTDMHGERDMLVRKVFPVLRQRCAERRVVLREVDLRWGVTEQETQDAQGLRLCLDEVEACSPFFIGLIGSRYGWCPPQYDVPRDDPRYDWVREYPAGRSVTELEIYSGAVRKENPRAFFYFRSPTFLDEVPAEHRRAFAPESPEAENRLEELRAMVRSATRNVVTYGATWGGTTDGRPVAAGLAPLHRRVLDDLWANICAEFPEEDKATGVELPSDLVAERNRMDATFEEHTRAFVGRRDVLDRLSRWADGPGCGTLLLASVPGGGKTATTAAFSKKYQESRRNNTLVIPHFIQAGENVRRVLWRLCAELSIAAGLFAPDASADSRSLTRSLAELAEAASFRARVLIVIDGLDQLNQSERAHALEWLPSSISCKVIVTAAPDSEPARVLCTRIGVTKVDLIPLELLERRLLVRARLASYGKKLDESAMNDQMRGLLKKTDAGRPLYLAVAVDELRVAGVFDDLSDRVRALNGQLPRLLEDVLARVENDHGRALVSQALSALACARGGLYEDELLALLRRPDRTGEEVLPRAVWARLAASLGTFLHITPADSESGSHIDFAHGLLRASVERRYLTQAARTVQAHMQLAAVFVAAADPQHDATWGGSSRGLSEAVHHLVLAQVWPQVVAALTSLAYIERKSAAGLVADLLEDYDAATHAAKEYAGQLLVMQFNDFVLNKAHVLSSRPHLTFQEAANQPDETAPAIEAKKLWKAAAQRRIWLQHINKPQTADPCRLTLAGYGDAVLAVAFSPQGEMVAAAGADCSIRVNQVSTGREIACLAAAHSSAVVCLSWSVDGHMLASASWDCTARIWDGASSGTFAPLCTLKGHEERLSACLFTADSQRLVTASWDSTVRVWKVSDGAQIAVLSSAEEPRPINSISLAPDSRYLLAASWSGEAIVWDLEDKKAVRTIPAHKRSAKAVVWSPGGRQAASASSDGRVRLWDGSEGELVGELGTHAYPVNALSFSPSGEHVASASDDGSVRVWDAALGRQLGVPRTAPVQEESGSSPSAAPTLLTLSLSKDGRRALTSTGDCDVVVWDIADEADGGDFTPVGKIRGHQQLVNAAEFDPLDRFIVTASSDATIKIWDARSLVQVKTLTSHSGGVNSIAFDAEGGRMVSASDDFNLILWETAKWTPIATLRGHSAPVRHISYAPNGKLVASVSRDGTIRVWNSQSGKLLHSMNGHRDWINSCAWSPDSKKLATCSYDFNCKLWSMKKGKESRTLSGHDGSVEAARFSPDGTLLATASSDGTLKIWNPRVGNEITTLRGHTSRVLSLEFARNGAWLASVSDDGTLRRWALMVQSEAARLAGHGGMPTRSCAFSPDGALVATAADDATVRIWSWREAAAVSGSTSRPKHHAAAVNMASFSPDGSHLMTAGADGALKLWDTTSSGSRARTIVAAHGGASVRCVAFSQSGSTVASAGDDGCVRLWDLRGGALASANTISNAHGGKSVRTASFVGQQGLLVTGGWDSSISLWDSKSRNSLFNALHCEWVESVSASPSGRTVASASRDGVIKTWEVSSRGMDMNREFASSEDSATGWTTSMSFAAPNGTSELLACGLWDGSVPVWDTSSGQKVVSFGKKGAPVSSVQFAPNGRHVMSAAADGTLKLWDLRRTGSPVLEFVVSAPATAVAISGKAQLIAAGDSLGSVYLLKYIRCLA